MRFLLTIFSIVLLMAQPAWAASQFVASSTATFSHPHDLTLDPKQQYLYVADTGQHRVQVLDPDSLNVLGSFGEGVLDSPHDVTFDHQGHLLVADSGNNRVLIYEVDGVKSRQIGQLEHRLASPEGVTSASDGSIYVTSAGNDRISMFKEGKFYKVVGGSGGSPGRFLRPHDIELGEDGLLYVCDPGNNRVQLLKQDMSPQGELIIKGKPFREPKYLALSQRHVFVADQTNNLLRIFNQNWDEVESISTAGDKRLNNPEGIEVVGKRLWIADTYNNRVLLFHWQAH